MSEPRYSIGTGSTFRIAASAQTLALRACMFAAVAAGEAAGGYATMADAARRIARLRDERYEPIEANHRTYDMLFGECARLQDLSGRGGDPAVKTLRRLRREVIAATIFGSSKP